MITKQEFVSMFNANKGKNFVINTNIAVGRGLNGVDYENFVGSWEDKDYYKCTYIIGVTENCAVLKTINQIKDWWHNGTRIQFIPFANINKVSFMDNDCRAYSGVYPKMGNDWNTLEDYKL